MFTRKHNPIVFDPATGHYVGAGELKIVIGGKRFDKKYVVDGYTISEVIKGRKTIEIQIVDRVYAQEIFPTSNVVKFPKRNVKPEFTPKPPPTAA